MKTPKAKQPAEPKINELKAIAYKLARQISGRTMSQTKQLRRWIDGVDFRKKSSWKIAIAILEEIINRDIVPQLLIRSNTKKLSQPYNNEYPSTPTDQQTKAGSISRGQCNAA